MVTYWRKLDPEETRRNKRAFEVKCLRYVLRISWIEKRTNEWVMGAEQGGNRKTAAGVDKRKLTYFGHDAIFLLMMYRHSWHVVGHGGALVESIAFDRRVVGSTPTLAAM